MLFNSQAFLLAFLPLSLLIYYACFRQFGQRASLAVLVSASLFFYAWWNPLFLPLLVGSMVVNYAIGNALGRSMNHSAKRGNNVVLLLGLVFNLGLLGYFKYAGFLMNTVNTFTGKQDIVLNIVLPLGISFFTFQQISYLVDAWRRRAPGYDMLRYSAYVSFFPQLISGPIVRHRELIPQFEQSPTRDGLFERLGNGAVLFAIGLFKKVVIADSLGKFVDPIFTGVSAGQEITAYAAWMASAAFSLQVYFDFSGYSDMALGLALFFGFRLPFNFNAPFAATDLREFWQRWHMTLTRFLRDYLFVPIARHREIPLSRFLAITITMLLCGLWHGASWTFVVWGGLHGLGLAANTVFSKSRFHLPDPVGWILTIGFFVVCATLFRADSFAVAVEVWQGMMTFELPHDAIRGGDVLLVFLAGLIAAKGPTSQSFVFDHLRPTRWLAIATGFLLTAMVLFVGANHEQEFVYFQF